MTVTLDATLKSALDGAVHNPICKIVSTSLASDIPFDGQLFNSQTADEWHPRMTVLASGRLACVFNRDGDLYLMYSDEARTLWSEVRIFDNASISGFSVGNQALIELSNGNIGIVFSAYSSTKCRFYSMIIGPTGTVVSAASQIVEHTRSSVEIWDPSTCLTATGFLLVYKYVNTAASPATFSFYKRTCTSFGSWSAASAISISGLISTRAVDYPNLLRTQAGAIYIFFDYVDDVVDNNERRNIYYSISTNEGASWSAAVKLTNYGDFSASAVAPSASEKTNGDIVVAYHAQISVLKIGSSSTGYCTSVGMDTDNFITDLFYIASSGKLYLVSTRTTTGYKALLRVLVIDVPTWSIEKCYRQDGSPGWNDVWSNTNGDASIGWTQISTADGDYIAIGDNHFNVMLINTQTDQIREYHLDGWPAYGYTKNVSGYSLQNYDTEWKLFLDLSTNRLYMLFYGVYVAKRRYHLGYFDITETADPITGLYTFHEAWGEKSIDSDVEVATETNTTCHFNISEDKLIISIYGNNSGDQGQLMLHAFSTGSLIKKYWTQNNAGFPRLGVSWPVYVNGVIYANTHYEALYGQADRRGLCLINTDTDAITFERPSYLTLDDYHLKDIKIINSGADLVMGSDYGVVFYSIVQHTWERYTRSNVPGLYTDSSDYSPRIAYDEESEMVFTSHCYVLGFSDLDLSAFIRGGNLYRGKYIQGALSGGSYNFGSEADLHLRTGGSHLTVVYDANDVLWNIWMQHAANGEISLMWDRDSFNPDVSDYVLAGVPVTVEWEIGRVAKVNFVLARADLFDPTNSMSIYAPVFKKGRLVELAFGERVSGVEYWQAQGVFVVTGSHIDYRRTAHPVIEISAEDRSVFWSEMTVTATEGYRNSPLDDVLDDLLQDIANLGELEYTVPVLANAHNLYCQWVDMDLAAIIEQICQHFGVFGHWGTDGKWTLKPIDLDAATAHDYTTAQSKLIGFSPDDRYASFINQVRVTCESQDFLEVLWDEERITGITGVVGFWTKQEEHKVHYSNNGLRSVRYPRLDIIQSINDFSPLISLLGGKGDEYIDELDPNETWCIIKIEAPDRAVYAFAFAAAIAAFGAMAIYCEVRFYCGVLIMATNLALSIFIQIVTAAANFAYDIWGQPIGKEKQTFQAVADDSDFQQFVGGLMVSQHFEDPLSYLVQHCQMVADQELAIIRAQRKRIAFEKVAHLQDEIADIVRVEHPVSGNDMRIFIAKLKRSFTRPPITGGSGQFSDSIEGWEL